MDGRVGHHARSWVWMTSCIAGLGAWSRHVGRAARNDRVGVVVSDSTRPRETTYILRHWPRIYYLGPWGLQRTYREAWAVWLGKGYSSLTERHGAVRHAVRQIDVRPGATRLDMTYVMAVWWGVTRYGTHQGRAYRAWVGWRDETRDMAGWRKKHGAGWRQVWLVWLGVKLKWPSMVINDRPYPRREVSLGAFAYI